MLIYSHRKIVPLQVLDKNEKKKNEKIKKAIQKNQNATLCESYKMTQT